MYNISFVLFTLLSLTAVHTVSILFYKLCFIYLYLFQEAQEQTLVSVYYESLCPDSIRFITTQLYPTFQQLSLYFNVNFVPYGKANVNIYLQRQF